MKLKFEKLEPQQDSNLFFHFSGVLSVYTIRLAERMLERLRTPKTPPSKLVSFDTDTPKGVSSIEDSSVYLDGFEVHLRHCFSVFVCELTIYVLLSFDKVFDLVNVALQHMMYNLGKVAVGVFWHGAEV